MRRRGSRPSVCCRFVLAQACRKITVSSRFRSCSFFPLLNLVLLAWRLSADCAHLRSRRLAFDAARPRPARTPEGVDGAPCQPHAAAPARYMTPTLEREAACSGSRRRALTHPPSRRRSARDRVWSSAFVSAAQLCECVVRYIRARLTYRHFSLPSRRRL